ncbi:M16 family metallopeptidase [Luteococcus sp. Sow4_B9]|uniref:M16 family metallopeptidase n=1 Tax=Luteococcus sp. Sow4_B9 TaxID=3438792 RepID=UPI003F981C6B
MTQQRLPRPELRAARPWSFPQARERTLPNGLRVWAFDLPGQHVVTATLVLDLPLSVEDPALEGVTTITLRTSDEGTVPHPGEQIIDALESVGAAYDGGASATATVCSLDVPRTRFADAMPLFSEIVRQPTHEAADIARHVALRLTELEQTRISAPALAALAVRRVLFDPASRDSRIQGGEETTVAAITREAVAAFHAEHWRPDGATLVIAGELDADVDAVIDAAFGDWPASGTPAQHTVPMPRALPTTEGGRRVVHLVDLPDAVQTEIRVTGIGLDRSSPDFAPLQVAANAMGGSFGSRLNSVLREEKGFTYGVHFSVAPSRLGGTWAVSSSVRTEVTAEALEDTLRIIELDEDFSPDEISDAVSQKLGIAPLRYDTAGAIASQAATLAAAGWHPDFVNLHFRRIAQVSTASASNAYRRVVRKDNAHVVLVGDAKALTPQLEDAGYAVQLLVP